jgi:dipeptidase
MKKYTLMFSMAIALLLSGIQFSATACTNFLVTKGATTDGSTMISYSADSHVLYGELYYRPTADYPDGSMVDVYEWDSGKYLGKIKQVNHTYSVIGNMNEHQLAIGETTYGGREELFVQPGAIVDYGTLIYFSLQRAKTAREAIKSFGDLVAEYGYASEGESFSISDPNEVWILEMIGKGRSYLLTSKSMEMLAKENLPKDVLKGLKKLNGKNFIKEEAFTDAVKKNIGTDNLKKFKEKIIEATENTTKGAVWVARRVPDGYVCGHANQARITTFPLNDPENCIYSPDVISFAREKGWFSGNDKDFSFSDAYNPITFDGARFCEARVWSAFRKINSGMDQYLDYAKGENLTHRMPLWIKPDRKLTVQDVMNMMRDHYEGTPLDMTKDMGAGPYTLPYRWRPMTWELDGKTYLNERATSTQQTGFSFITQSRGWLPDHIGGINWFGVDDTYGTVYIPMYCGMTSVPETFAKGNGNMMIYSKTSAFWIFNLVNNWAYTRYCDMIPEIQAVQSELENKFVAYTPVIDKAAVDLYNKDPKLGRQFITDYSVNMGNSTVERWQQLFEYLFTKYMDGNIKTPVPNQMNPKVKQPGYGEDWYRRIVEQTGDRLRVKGENAH